MNSTPTVQMSFRSLIGVKLRALLSELRDFPATSAFLAVWVIIFVAMTILWVQTDPRASFWRFCFVGIGEGHRFGDLSLAELKQGQIWRLITCNFVHYSLLHILLNGLSFYMIGSLIESWYGTPQFISLITLSGGIGNLISMGIRSMLGTNPLTHSAGGSVIIMALIGLCAVVGIRAGSAMGRELSWQMAKALGMIAVVGLLLPRYIDNWGHLGGAIVGFGLGFLHRPLLRRYGRPVSWIFGTIALFILAMSASAQWKEDVREGANRHEVTLRVELDAYQIANRNLKLVRALIARNGAPLTIARLVESSGKVFEQSAVDAAYQVLQRLGEASQTRTLTTEELAEIKARTEELEQFVKQGLDARLREFWDFRRKAGHRRAG